jgi:hypothetical protein
LRVDWATPMMAATTRQPAKILPLMYFGAAHLSLGVAAAAAAWWPRAVAGFFYHSWMVGLVHLVTLGWITFSILGAIFIAGPIALRMEMPARRGDYVAFAFAIVGVIGMVGHFWIQEYGGMAWSAATVTCGVLYMTVRIVRALRPAPIEPAVKLHITLACANIWIAASMGVLIGADKVGHFLPGFVLANVFAHAHLAAIGWATMMVMGIGYRLLPMILAAKMPTGRAIYVSALLLEAGILGLVVTLLVRSAWVPLFGLLIVAGLVTFAVHVGWMLRHRVTPPAGLARPDLAVLHAAAAGMSLLAAVAIGIALLVMPSSPHALHLAAAYGVLGLVGFLAQMVVAMSTRLLPMAVWYWAFAANEYRMPPPSPHAMRDRTLQTIVFGGWILGVPLIAAGMSLESARLVGLGAGALLAAVCTAALDNAGVVRHAIRTARTDSRKAA